MNKPKPPAPIQCKCGFRIWDGDVVRSRVLRLTSGARFEAKCRCKRWIRVPVSLDAPEAGE